MSEQDMEVSTALMVPQESMKHQQEQVVELMLHDQSGGSLVQHLVDPSSLVTQTTTHDEQLLNKMKKPLPPPTTPKELSKQWKVLCKKAKEWCGLHGNSVPSFVMMYLDDNKLVWEGPDHMESFISDENVISAFLRTAVSTGAVSKDKRTNSSHLRRLGGAGASYDHDSFLDQSHQNVSEAESTVVQALEQLGQLQPAQGSDSQTSQYSSMAGSSQTVVCDDPGGDGGDDEDDDDDDDVDLGEARSPDNKMAEEGSDVLSEVIDSVIKEWEPGQDTKRCRGKRPPRPAPTRPLVKQSRHLTEVQKPSLKPRKRRRQAFRVPGTDQNIRLVRSSQPTNSAKKSERRREKVACGQCGKVVSRNNLSAHARLHRTDLIQEHVCNVCNKGFLKARDLKIHLTVHTGERPHKCQVCFKAFRLKVTLDEHMLTHTGEKPHVCEYCSRPFARRSDLRCHIRLHTGEKPYMCNHCGRRFSLSCNYNAHLRTHTGEQKRVFGPCQVCGRSFSNRKAYREHLKTHESENSGGNQTPILHALVTTDLSGGQGGGATVSGGSILYHPPQTGRQQTHQQLTLMSGAGQETITIQAPITIQSTATADGTVYYNLG